ncbi:inter-alpha-trypsin inhibitor heavy chain H2 [Microcaecilia unicolor]|uniref:Inter-alpha-trypsin inhibitor heavy chain H2 n=1 Tax=Microcaecilia unicolor TaxID=1415580 RepID=A0A6P7Z390_9AMPH|nr:inter-alpha-trypsin inhibitor heavy chain H2 [Microcaecilia unicolor]
MKRFLFFLIVLFLPEIQSFDLLIEDIPDSDDPGEMYLEALELNAMNGNGRYKRSTSSEEDEGVFETTDQLSLQSYKVESRITSHFVDTMIRSKIANKAKKSQNVVFDIQIPKGAFITNFTMNVNGIIFSGSIKEKSVARGLYAQARSKGKAAGLIRTSAFDMENFKAELNIPGGTKVQFEIHYQEILERKLGIYEHVLHLDPQKLTKNLQVDVYITEPQGISFVNTQNSLDDSFNELIDVSHLDKKAHISFKPTLEQQRKCPNCSTTAVHGNLVVQYDVQREVQSELQLFNGYFLHFFAPDNLAPLPKNILFVIDVSGSMWGLKMKQTVEAMKTILEDLRTEDKFSLIDFNHNVHCWREGLVSASPTEVEDAKTYVQNIQPNGGTNINEALLRAIFILNEAHKLGMLDPKSVSLIVLVSDGDPTVGELKLTKIQQNVKQQMRNDFSLHSLGIGFDVDYDFLEKLALDNHGKAQRIYGNQETAEQLKQFYKQISTPLLRNVMIQYAGGAISDVTQNNFNNYFKGSEIVVAGKVEPESVQVLESIVRAGAANMDLMVNTVAEAEALAEFMAESKHSFSDFAKQYWAQLTIQQLLAERNLAPNAAAKRNITKTILQLSIDHHIVTPLTAMLIESANGDERMLADSPRDARAGCCSGSTVFGTKTPSTVPPWAKPTPDSETALAAETGPVVESTPPPPPPKQHITEVDSDPHFIIHLPKSQKDVCFNIDSTPGNIMNLVSDPDSGVVVNGLLIGAKQSKNRKLSTFFGAIGFYFRNQDLKIEVSTEKIMVNDSTYSNIHSWSETSTLTYGNLIISVKKNSNVTISVNEEMTFLVLLHRVWKKHPVNVDFLGIYIPHTNKFSPTAHGLIGQFTREPEVQITNVRPGSNPEKPEATMGVKGHKLTVTRGWQKDYRTDTATGTDVRCWFVHNSGKGFIDGHYKDYLVPEIYSFL